MSDLGYADFLDSYELAVKFTWAGGEYTGARGDRSEGYMLGDGGFGSVSDLVLVCPVAQFGSNAPKKPDSLTVDGKEFRCDTVMHSPDGKFVVINLITNNRGV